MVFNGRFSAKLPQAIQRLAARKLVYLDGAEELEDLRSPPGNNLKTLKDDRHGQHSIRINDQWRICFVWRANNAYQVEIVYYHLGETEMGKRDFPPIHPGEVLREEFLVPLCITQYRLAKEIHVPARRINEIVLEKRGISADTALRLGRFFGTTALLWINLQARYDLEMATEALAERLEAEIKPFRSAA